MTVVAAAPAGGLNVSLSSSSSAVRLPGAVKFPAGAKTANVTGSTNLVSADVKVTVTATLSSSGSSATLAASGKIPAGQTSATFPVKTATVTQTTTVTLKASLNSTTAAATLKLESESTVKYTRGPTHVRFASRIRRRK